MMKFFSPIRAFLDFVIHRSRVEREMEEEFRSHIASRAKDLQRQGISRKEAERRARIEFGAYQGYKEECREALGTRLLQELAADIRYGLRQLCRNPGFTAVAILTLALGIGANTAIFSVIDAALLRPLPYPRPQQLVDISSLRMNGNPEVIAADFRAWQENAKVLGAVGAFGLGFNSYSEGANLTGPGDPSRVRVVPVSVGFFRMLGVAPVLGRDFSSDEGKASHADVALLSATIWHQYFGGDRAILNKTVHLDGRPYTIIGVMPAGLLFPPGDIWVPLVLDASNSLPSSPTWTMLYVIGRLKGAVDLRQATADLQMVSRRLDSEFSPGWQRGRSHLHVQVIPLRQLLAGDVAHLLLILLSAVSFVLLIACANLANLQLARAAARNKEMTVRSALGAGRWRLVRQALSESLLLAFFGGCLGLASGLWAERALRRLVPPQLPSAGGLDHWVLAFGVAVTFGAAILFGLVPAFVTSRVDVNEALKEGGPHAGLGRSTHRLRSLLVIGETALALILLVSAGLLGRSLLRLTEVPLGFNPDHLLLGEVWLPVTLVDQPQQQANFFHAVLERLHSMSGVQYAAATTHYPVSVFNALATGVRASDGGPSQPSKPFSLAYVSPEYFRTMGIPILRGRPFRNNDAWNTRKVVILSESAARNIFSEREAVGQEIRLDGPKGPWWYVVGVVADTRNYQLDRQPWPEIFFPYQQQPSLFMTFVVRSDRDPMQLASSLRYAVASVDPNEPISAIETMNDVVQKVLSPRRFKLALLGTFALLALALGAIGIYGVVSYTVMQRTHEIGIRMAMGAERHDVLKMVVGQGLRLALIGVAIGIAGALALTRFLSSLLYGVKPTDPRTFIAVSLILIAVALLACYIPARRAAKVDPMIALRYE